MKMPPSLSGRCPLRVFDQCRLAVAGDPGDADDLAAFDLKVDRFDRWHAVVVIGQKRPASSSTSGLAGLRLALRTLLDRRVANHHRAHLRHGGGLGVAPRR